MDSDRRVDSLILLVGSNPLPNYLAAMALKSKKVHLVYSKDTEKPKERLHDALDEDLGSSATIDGDAFIKNAFIASDVGEKIRDLLLEKNSPVHLHYTGGTKVMSAHALKAFYEKGGQPQNASYLDEVHACLRFDDGDSKPLSAYGATFTLDRILQLHGITPKLRLPVNDGPNTHDLAVISRKVLSDPSVAEKLYCASKELKKHKDKPDKAIPVGFDSVAYSLAFSVRKIPDGEGWGKDRFKAWWRFLGGEWLEDWVTRQIRMLNLTGVSDKDISMGVTCTREETGREFEVDVAVLRGQRSYFLSCTTDASLSCCKSKAFEIAARSRQMGGDLARSALVCLLHGHNGKSKFIDQLRADVDDVWGASNTTRIFGLDDLRDWAGLNGSPNLSELKKWLES